MLTKIAETASYLKQQLNVRPETGIILGSGLGNLANELTDTQSIPYSNIPHFPVSTVAGHSGRLVVGKLCDVPVLVMQGRFHYYEGYSMQEITFPVRVMKELGIKILIVSNASGGMNPDFLTGDVMLITDHINFFPEHPLRGKNWDELGERFPDMSEVYSRRLINKALEIAADCGVKLQQGVYVGVQGPTFETPAEYRMFRFMGGDAVGMSTVPEVIVANHAGIEVFALSVITDLGIDGKVVTVSHEEVQQAAKAAEPKMTLIIREILKKINV
ncbi:MAG: purine-nucleoside phosphorylase [Bacteroidales bacterium]|jgi:purine-nucleoside phosphorylase|nr:purine-nucleoside phosphorylase [Bacteroidales bacterium]